MAMPNAATAPVRQARILAPDVSFERRPDGVWYARSPHTLGPYPATITKRLEHWAFHAPDRTFLAERDDTGAWRRVSYGEALTRVALDRAVAARSARVGRPADCDPVWKRHRARAAGVRRDVRRRAVRAARHVVLARRARVHDAAGALGDAQSVAGVRGAHR
jgi:hypothetical protein